MSTAIGQHKCPNYAIKVSAPFHEIFVGSLKAMEMCAERGVKGLNPQTHKWQIVSPSARYQVVKTKEIVVDDETGEKGWCASLFCSEDLRAIAKEKGLIL